MTNRPIGVAFLTTVLVSAVGFAQTCGRTLSSGDTWPLGLAEIPKPPAEGSLPDRDSSAAANLALPTPIPPPPTGDVDRDGDIDGRDLFQIASKWRQPVSYQSAKILLQTDLSGNGSVDGSDLVRYVRDRVESRKRTPPSPSFPHPPILLGPENSDLFLNKEVQYAGAACGIDFSWCSVIGADSYELVVDPPRPEDTGTFPSAIWPKVHKTAGIKIYGMRLPFDYNIDPEKYDGLYSWRVRAWKNDQPGTFSEARYFKVVAEFPPPMGDVNDDSNIDAGDLFQIASNWLRSATPQGDPLRYRMDISRNQVIDGADLDRYIRDRLNRRETALAAPSVIQPATGSGWNQERLMTWLNQGIPFLLWTPVEGVQFYDVETIGYNHQNPQHNELQHAVRRGIPYESRAGCLYTWAMWTGEWAMRVRGRSSIGRAGPWSPWALFVVQ